MKWPRKFTSVHDYLDECFLNSDPTENEIIKAKRWYWRCYNTDLKRRRSHYINVSVYFSKEELERIKTLIKKGSLSDFIKKLVLSYLEGTSTVTLLTDTTVIEEQLFLITEYLLELMNENNAIHSDKLSALESQIKTLQSQVETIV